jgi:hypothetical protein
MSFPSDGSVDSRLTPPYTVLSPLFDERSSQSPLVSSPDIAEPMSGYTYTSSLFSSPQLPQFTAVQATGPTPRHSPGLGAIRESPQSSFSSFPSDGSVDSRLTPPYTVLSPLFDERPSQSPPFSSLDIAEPMSGYNYTGSLFSSPQLPQFAAGLATGSTPRHSPGLGAIRESPQSSFPSFPSDGSLDSRLTPPYTVLSPLFDERPSQSPPFSSLDIAEPMSGYNYTGSLFSSPQLPQFAAGSSHGLYSPT